MSERFIRLYELQNSLYSVESPVIVSAGALLKDTQTNNMIVQLKFHSVSATPIKALKVGIAAFDIAGKEIEGVDEYQYLDLNIQNGYEFGSNKAIVMPDAVTRSFSIRNITVVLENGNVQDVSMPMTALPKTTSLQSGLKDAELVKQYKLAVNDKSAYIPQETDDLWMCSCGEWNNGSSCTKCHGQKNTVFSAYNTSALANAMNIRLAEERQYRVEQERLAEKARADEAKRLEVEAKRRKEQTKKAKIALAIILPVVGIVLAFACYFYPDVIKPGREYQTAEELLNAGKYDEAIEAFEKLGDYKDSRERAQEIYYNEAEKLFTDGEYIAAATAFEKIGDYQDANEYAIKAWYAAYAHTSISTGYFHTLGLKNDGTVVSTGSNRYGQCDTSEWENIVSVAAGGYHSVGLKSDGTVVAVGGQGYGECDVESWSDIISISAGERFTIGLKSDRTVVLTGEMYDYRRNGLSKWENVTAIFSNSGSTYGLTEAGTIISESGSEVFEGCNDFIAFSAESYTNYIGIKKDGTVMTGGLNDVEVHDFSNIVQVACGKDFTLGVLNDGTVAFSGTNDTLQNVALWTDIVLVSAQGINGGHVVAVKVDGTAIAAGNNKYGQCDVSDWADIRVPQQVN